MNKSNYSSGNIFCRRIFLWPLIILLSLVLFACDGSEDETTTTPPVSHLYKVWGGTTDLRKDIGCYDPGTYGYTLLGQDTATQIFNGTYLYYVIMVERNAQAFVDTVQGSTGAYYDPVGDGNTSDPANIGGAPDGLVATLGENYTGGCIIILPTDSPSTLTVYIP